MVVRAERGILARWSDYFLAGVRRGLRTSPSAPVIRSSTGLVPAAAGRWWGSNQAALSLALWNTTRAVELLPAGYNYPLHQHAQAPEPFRAAALAHLVLVHYHFMFDADFLSANPLLRDDSPLPAARLAWLRSRIPLDAPAAGTDPLR